MKNDVIDPRLQHRREEVRVRQQRKRHIKIGVLIMVVVVLGSACIMLFSPLGTVREVTVVGVQHAEVDKVLKTAGVKGKSLLLLDTEEIQKKIARVPWVDEVALRSSFPSKVTIDITERVPIAKVQAQDGDVFFDSDGVILGAATGEFDPLPVIHFDDQPPMSLVAPENLGDRYPAARYLVTLLASLKKETLQRISDVAVSGDEFVLLVDGNIRVRGSLLPAPELTQRAVNAMLLGGLDLSAIGEIDLRVPQNPVTKPRTTTPEPTEEQEQSNETTSGTSPSTSQVNSTD